MTAAFVKHPNTSIPSQSTCKEDRGSQFIRAPGNRWCRCSFVSSVMCIGPHSGTSRCFSFCYISRWTVHICSLRLFFNVELHKTRHKMCFMWVCIILKVTRCQSYMLSDTTRLKWCKTRHIMICRLCSLSPILIWFDGALAETSFLVQTFCCINLKQQVE